MLKLYAQVPQIQRNVLLFQLVGPYFLLLASGFASRIPYILSDIVAVEIGNLKGSTITITSALLH